MESMRVSELLAALADLTKDGEGDDGDCQRAGHNDPRVVFRSGVHRLPLSPRPEPQRRFGPSHHQDIALAQGNSQVTLYAPPLSCENGSVAKRILALSVVGSEFGRASARSPAVRTRIGRVATQPGQKIFACRCPAKARRGSAKTADAPR
jgi:hypothetical protein